MNLTFSVKNQIITRTDSNAPVSDSVGFLKAVFTFVTSEWDGLTKTAIFHSKGGNYEVILQNNECTIPWEVLMCKWFSVSVFAGNLITANSVTVEQIPSGYIKGEKPTDPTPSVYTQIIGMIEDISTAGVTISQASGNIIELKTDGIYATGGGTSGKTISQITAQTTTESGGSNTITVKYTDNTTDSFVIHNGVKGDKGDKGNNGDSYTITATDYNAIANVVLGMLTVAEEQEV